MKETSSSLFRWLFIVGAYTMYSGYEKVKGLEGQNPKQTAGVWSLLTFSWLTGLVEKGNSQPLETVDLFPLLQEDQSEELTNKLEKCWRQTKGKHCAKTSPGFRLVRALWGIIPTSECCLIATFLIIDAVARLTQPLFLIGLLAVLMDDHPSKAIQNNWVPYYYAIGISINTFVMAIFRVHVDYRSSLVGMRVRSALLGLLYKKALCLSTCDLAGLTSGHVINLISNDVHRFDGAVTFLPNFCLAPFTVIAACSVSLYLIGWPVLPGFAFLAVVIGFQAKAATLGSNLRKKAAELGDCRLKVLNEIICGIRTVKMNTWESHFRNKVKSLRRSEVRNIMKIGIISASFSTLTVTTQSLVSLIIFLVLLITGSMLNPFNIFLIFSYVYLLKDDVSFYLALGFSKITQCYMSAGRIQELLEMVDSTVEQQTGICKSHLTFDNHTKRENSNQEHCRPNEESNLFSSDLLRKARSAEDERNRAEPSFVSMIDVTCLIGNTPILRNISFQARDSKFVVLAGPVGCGKSSLLLAMLGEMPISQGQLNRSGKVAYVPQIPWVFSGTLRENILFHSAYDPQRYAKVIKVCALEKDVSTFPDGDFTMLGERGIVLSGGQRARIGLARAVYSDADLYFLDDPLSAVDAEVAHHIFERCICGMLVDRVRVLATHQCHYLQYAEHILLMQKGAIEWSGSYTEMPNQSEDSEENDSSLKNNKSSEQKAKSEIHGSNYAEAAAGEESLTVAEEDRQFGSVSRSTYWHYIKAGKFGYFTILLFLLLTFAQIFRPVPDWWMAGWHHVTWSSADDRHNVYVYMTLVLCLFLLSLVSCLLLYVLMINSAKHLHDTMVSSILQAPVLFFDTNPSGRILNRFSKDVGVMDEDLTYTLHECFQTFFMLVMSILVPAMTNYWVVIAGIPLTALTMYYGRSCIRVSREVARLDAINRSFMYSHFSLTLEGMVTIRAHQKQANCVQQFYRYQDQLAKTWFVSLSTIRWLDIRLDIMASLFVTVVTFVAVMTSQLAGYTGLAAIYSTRLLNNLTNIVRELFHLESMMTSVERVLTYIRLESEPGYDVPTESPNTWPKDATIELDNLALVYYPKGPQVLKNLTFTVESHEKLGIAGRTGAGKSSIVAALMRMPEPTGQILIDGVDVQQLNLPYYRSRLSVISQDPVLFSGMLRDNLDPTSHFSDLELWNVLKSVHLRPLVETLDGQLYYELTEGGANLSVGQRQLLCLARALLQGNKIIVLDEATANVDFTTDGLIQETIRNEFKHCTVLTIAHRVSTILDYDRVMVLEGGSVVEFDRPEKLLEIENGRFAELCTYHNVK